MPGVCLTRRIYRKGRMSPAKYCDKHPVSGVRAIVGTVLRLVAGEAQQPAYRFHLPVRQPETLLEELQGGDRRLGPGGLVDVAEGRVFLDILDVNAGQHLEVLLRHDVESRASSDIILRPGTADIAERSEEQKSELQSLMRISYAVFCLKKKQRT